MMRRSARARSAFGEVLLLALLLVAGAALWLLHAQAWDLGGRSPILDYDAAQYALAGRELAWHGRLATPYALPVDLVTQRRPPWPLSAVQPGLVLAEAAIFRLVPARGGVAGSDPRAWLTIVLPFCSFLMLGAGVLLGVSRLLGRFAPDAPAWARVAAPPLAGLMVLLDPEAQHFAIGGFTELPFTVGLLFSFMGIVSGAAVAWPLAYGVGLGLTGLFRANMLWLAPLFALAAAWTAPPGRRARVAALALAGYALPLAPWWLYKWREFGSPFWDLTRYVVWDGVRGYDWFGLFHRAALPDVPGGMAALPLLLPKLARNLPVMTLAMLTGPRALWIGSLVVWLALTLRRGARGPRPLAAAAAVALAGAASGVLAASLAVPWLRYVFPTRVLVEPAGALAAGALVLRSPLSPPARRIVCGALAALAIAWGAWSTSRGLAEAREVSRERGVPESATLTGLSIELNRVLAPGEPVMSNLGPSLAWQTNHPVVHLALTPDEVAACRRRLDLRHLVLVFRDARRAWTGWQEIVARPGAAATIPALAVVKERRFRTVDGFDVVWLELGPLAPGLAMR